MRVIYDLRFGEIKRQGAKRKKSECRTREVRRQKFHIDGGVRPARETVAVPGMGGRSSWI